MIRDILKIDGAQIIKTNFAGREEGTYNREGDRNFLVVIDDPEIANAMAEDGWNVKIKAPKEEGDDPFCFLQVTVKFSEERPHLDPVIYLQTGKSLNRLGEDTVGKLDEIDIEYADMDIRPYNWSVQGKTGVTAYLTSIKVVQRLDRHMMKFREEEHPEE